MYVSTTDTPSYACGCIGPQNGEPLCPCQMRNVTIRNGRYIREEDLGPARPTREDCLHDKCEDCGGTGQRKDGLGPCVHMLSCTCPKCSIRC